MKRFLGAVALAALTAPAFAADVGVSVRVGEPGFYGRIDIGNFPQPQVIYRQPVVIETVVVHEAREPIYLRVPPGHQKNWRKHCGRYNACGERVYFVQDDWYNREYAPRYRERHGGDQGERHDEDRGERHDDDRGKGHDRGHGNGRGHRND
jgi:hypothetical protein